MAASRNIAILTISLISEMAAGSFGCKGGDHTTASKSLPLTLGDIAMTSDGARPRSALWSASPTDPVSLVLAETDSGEHRTLKVGELVQVELATPASAGYLWHLDDLYKDRLELVSERILPPENRALAGAPARTRWILKATATGPASLATYLYRPWEGREKAVRGFRVGLQID